MPLAKAPVTPKVPPARAVVLYGRVGTYTTRTATMKKGVPGDESLWRNCAESIRLHVVKPWSGAGRVDVFVQSWNPELGSSMGTFWDPRAADHAAQNGSMGRCPVRLNYCDRTMWALLGMKRALALRMRWAASSEGRDAPPHATVLVMRHDVMWSNSLPPLRADRSVRLWLPFDCQRAACRDRAARASDLYAERPPVREACVDGKRGASSSSNWTLLQHKTNVLGVNCAASRGPRAGAFCGNSVNIDWWWAGDAALADGFSETYDQFGHYSKLIKEHLNFHNSAPHHYWGLYFFHTNKIRERCQLGHANVAGVDFTLGRFVPPAESNTYMNRYCRLAGWRAYWRPPGASAIKRNASGTSQGTCNASAIPGYLTMCPGTPSHPLRRTCGAPTENGTLAKQHGGARNGRATNRSRVTGGGRRAASGSGHGGGGGGGGGHGGGGANIVDWLKNKAAAHGLAAPLSNGAARPKAKAARAAAADHLHEQPTSPEGRTPRPKSAREALKELSALKEESLISEAEWEKAKRKVLEGIVARGVAGAAAAGAAEAGAAS